MSYTSMPFGKYKGVEISKVPTDYLKWCLETITFKKPELRDAIEVEVIGRESQDEDYKDFGPQFDPDDEIPF